VEVSFCCCIFFNLFKPFDGRRYTSRSPSEAESWLVAFLVEVPVGRVGGATCHCCVVQLVVGCVVRCSVVGCCDAV
jgi:hypothetical protein